MPVIHTHPSRSILSGLVAVLGLLAACDPATAPGTAESGPAALLIVGPDREMDVTCVTLKATEVSGRELLELAGVPVTLDERNAMGALVCAIDGQGCDYPAEPCLCQCQGLADCAYWASFVRTPPGAWTYAGQGVSTQQLRAGDLYAWVWLPTASNNEALELLYDGMVGPLCP